jgi:hypothetical protein
MSASLIVLIPVVLLGVVTSLCFVGCWLGTHGNVPAGPYETAVSATGNLVAFWQLNDLPQTGSAFDAAPKQPPLVAFNGTVVGNVTQNVTGIIPSDLVDTLATCALFTNGSVQVDFHQELNPATFTLEAWVRPNWTPADPQVQRAVLVSANSVGAGYGLFATPDNFWEAQIGTGGGNFLSVKATQSIFLNLPNPPFSQYLAVTFDGTMLTLFVGVVGVPLVAAFQGTTANFVREQPMNATSLFIGMGLPETLTGMFPFNGFIQDVAVYNVALDAGTIQAHFTLGSTPPG